MNSFQGAGVALITPFNSDLSIDYPTLERLIDYQIKEGVDYLVSLGTTGETATLNEDEKMEVWSFTAKIVANRIPLIAGIGGNNTLAVIDAIKKIESLGGYSAILSVSPYYNKPSQEGLYLHYKEIAKQSTLPVLLYNVPGRTTTNLDVDTILRLANECKNIIGIKEASANFDQFNRLLRDKPTDFLLISGDDAVTLPMMALGAVGIISVVGNAFPKAVSDLTKLCAEMKFNEARATHNSLVKMIKLCFEEGNPAGVKAILNEIGFGKDVLRLPLTPVGQSTRDAIKEELKQIDFLPK